MKKTGKYRLPSTQQVGKKQLSQNRASRKSQIQRLKQHCFPADSPYPGRAQLSRQLQHILMQVGRAKGRTDGAHPPQGQLPPMSLLVFFHCRWLWHLSLLSLFGCAASSLSGPALFSATSSAAKPDPAILFPEPRGCWCSSVEEDLWHTVPPTSES